MDRALGKHVISEKLKSYSRSDSSGFNIKVICLDDKFPGRTPDEDWLKVVGDRGRIVITKDKRIRYRRAEFDIVKKHEVKMFTLTSGNLTGNEMAEIIVKAIPKIHKFIQTNEPPFIATIAKSGVIKRIKIS